MRASTRKSRDLVIDVIHDLADRGFRVLDIKPGHVILRKDRDGNLLTRHGRVDYALVDFELLQRTEEYQLWRHNASSPALISGKCDTHTLTSCYPE